MRVRSLLGRCLGNLECFISWKFTIPWFSCSREFSRIINIYPRFLSTFHKKLETESLNQLTLRWQTFVCHWLVSGGGWVKDSCDIILKHTRIWENRKLKIRSQNFIIWSKMGFKNPVGSNYKIFQLIGVSSLLGRCLGNLECFISWKFSTSWFSCSREFSRIMVEHKWNNSTKVWIFVSSLETLQNLHTS